MSENKRRYTEEFKRQAVELAEQTGSISGAARQLGIYDSLIHAWRKKFSGKQANSANETPSEEVLRLRRENAELKKANHILKAAAAFFSQDHLK